MGSSSRRGWRRPPAAVARGPRRLSCACADRDPLVASGGRITFVGASNPAGCDAGAVIYRPPCIRKNRDCSESPGVPPEDVERPVRGCTLEPGGQPAGQSRGIPPRPQRREPRPRRLAPARERRSSPFFPVKVSERTRRFAGVGPPASLALAARKLGPGLTTDAAPALGGARTHSPASCSSARGPGSRRPTRAAPRWLHPTPGGARGAGGVPPQMPVRPSARGAPRADAGGAPCEGAG